MATATFEARPGIDPAEATIEQALATTSQHLRMRALTSGGLWAGAACFLACSVLILVHASGKLPAWAGIPLLGLLGLSVTVVIARMVLRPMLTGINPYYSAHTLEAVLPECRNSLINWLDLRHQPMPLAIRGALIKRALKDVHDVDIAESVQALPQSRMPATMFSIAAIALVLLLALMGPGSFARALTRGLTPWIDHPVVCLTHIEILDPAGGNGSIRVGHDMAIRVELTGKIPEAGAADAALLHMWNTPDQIPVTIPMAADASRADGIWLATVPRDLIHTGFTYRVTAGDARTADHEVTVRLDMFVQSIKTRVAPPAYLRLDPIEGTELGISAIRGSTIAVAGTASGDLKSAELHFTSSKTGISTKSKFNVSPDSPKAFQGNLPSSESGNYYIHLVGLAGDIADTLSSKLEIVEDSKPTFKLLLPATTPAKLRLVDSEMFQVLVTDDHGLGLVTGNLVFPGHPKKPLAASGVPPLPGSKPVPACTASWTIRAADLRDHAGSKGMLVVTASDTRPGDSGTAELEIPIEILKNSTEIRMVQPRGPARLKAGENLSVVAQISGEIPEAGKMNEPRVHYRAMGDNEGGKSFPLKRKSEKDLWTGMVPSNVIGEGGWYQVFAGDAATPVQPVELASPLKLSGFSVKLDSPEYARVPPTVSREREIKAIAGSKATICLETNVPGVQGGITFQPTGGAEREIAGLPDTTNNRNLNVNLPLDKPGVYRAFVKGENQSLREMGTYPVEIIEDKPPVVELLEPADGTSVAVNGQLLLKIRAEDDLGLKSVIIRADWLVDGQEIALSGIGTALPAGETGPPRKIQTLHPLKLSDLRDTQGKPVTLVAGQKLRLKIEGRDHHPDPAHLGQSQAVLVNLTPAADEMDRQKEDQRQKDKMDQFQKDQKNQEQNENQGDKPMPGQGDKPMPGQGEKPMPGQGDKPMPGQGDKPMPGQGDKPMPGQGDKPMPGQGDKPMPGQGDKPMPGQGDKPMPGQDDKPDALKDVENRIREALKDQGDKPMPGQGEKPMPGQGDKPMPGQGDKPMPGQGEKPMPGQGDKPMPGQGEKPMPGQGDKPMPGQGEKPMPGQGEKPMPGQGDKPMPGQGDKPMPGQGDKPMPGQGDKPMPGQGEKPMPGQGDKPMPGQGDKPMPGQGDKPMPGQGDKPMPGQGDKPMPGQGDKPMPGQGDKPMPGQGDKPMPGQGDKPMPGQGDKPMPGQGDKPMPGQGDKPMPGQGDKPMPGQGDKPMPGQGDKPMPGQGDKPMPGQGDKPMPGQGDKPMPGQGDKPMPGQGDKPMPGQGDKPMPGQGDKPMPGQGDKPMPGQGDKPMPGQGDKPMPGQGDKPMPGQGDKPMPGQGDKPMPGQGDKPMPGQGDKPMPGQGDKPMPGQGDKPMPGQGDKPMPGQGDKPMPGQGDKPMPGQGDKPMPGQGDKPMPGQGDKPMPGQGDKPMPGQGDKPMPGQGDKPTPGQGDKPMPGQGDKPMPGQGDKPMPGQGDKPMPGQGDKPMPGQGDKPMPGQGDKPMPGQGDKPMPGQGDKPMPGQGDKPMPGQGESNDPAIQPGMNPTSPDNREAISGSREKADAVDPANAKAALAQLEKIQDQINKNKDKLKQQGISDEEIRKYQEYLKNRQANLEKDMARADQAAPQQAGGLGSVGARKVKGGTQEAGEAGFDNRQPPPAEYQDAWREFTRKRKISNDAKLK